MNLNTTNQPVSSDRKPWAIIMGAGLVCGVLDISAAFADAYFSRGVVPGRVLQAVGSGLLGPESFKLGAGSMVFGLALHFAVAGSWAALFFFVSRRFPALWRHSVLVGLIYGAFVYAAMNVGVLPFASWFRSLYLPTPVVFAPKFSPTQFFIHLVCVGLVIVLVTKKLARR